ncbi:MAG: hypothetical protein AAF701_04460 [Pseudomonadota bacterium]
MIILVWLGVALTCVGLGLLIWCIVGVMRARKAHGHDEAAMKSIVQRAVMMNLIAMGLSGLGLAILIVGLIL